MDITDSSEYGKDRESDSFQPSTVTTEPRIVYLVEDHSRVYKTYKDRFFIFTSASAALRKVEELGYSKILPEASDLLPGVYFRDEHDYTYIGVIAVPITGEL